MIEARSGEQRIRGEGTLEGFVQALLSPLAPYTVEALLKRLCSLFGAKAVVYHPMAGESPGHPLSFPHLDVTDSLLPADIMKRVAHNSAQQPYVWLEAKEAPARIAATMRQVDARYCWLHFREESSLHSAHYLEVHLDDPPEQPEQLALQAGIALLRILALPSRAPEIPSAAEELREHPEFHTLENAERVARFGRWVWDIRSNHTWFSGGMFALYGRDAAMGAPREDWMDSINPEDRMLIMAAIQQAFQTGLYSVDYRLRREDTGEEVFLHSEAAVDFDEDHLPLRMVGVAYDVSAVRATEQRLRRDRDLLRGITQSCPLAITLLSPTGEIIYANPGAEKVLGVSQTEIQQRKFNTPEWRHTTLDGDPLPESEMPFRIMMETREPVHGLKHGIEWPDGRRHILSIDGAPVLGPSGELESLVFVIEDVTRQIESDRALRESEQRFRQLVEMAPYGILLVDDDGTIVSVNHATELMFATHRSALSNTSALNWFSCPEPEVLSRRLMQSAVDGVTVRTADLEIAAQRGTSLVPVELMLAPMHIGTRRFVIIAIADLSEQRRMQHEQQELQRQRQLFQKMEGLGRLAGGIAHDINNLIHAIQSVVEMVLARGSLPEASAQELEEAMHACDRGSEIVGQLLAFARRPTAGNRVADLGSSVKSFTSLLQRAVGESVTIDVNDQLQRPLVISERADIEQILLNLCVNARDAMPEGGAIRIELSNAELDPGVSARHPRALPGGYGVLRVIDEGCGIPDELVERIFEPFFSTKPEHLGTGLGLATVYGLAERNGGFVEVTSCVGEGSTFTVFLPEVMEEQVISAPKLETPANTNAPVFVLVAEDDELIRAVTCRILEHAGHKVLAAVDGEEAIALFDIHKEEIGLAVLDVVMPKRSGKSVYAHIRKASEKLPVLFTTGYSPVELEPLLESDNAVFLLHKPYRTAELLSEIERMVQG